MCSSDLPVAIGVALSLASFILTDAPGVLHGWPWGWYSEISIFGSKLLLTNLAFNIFFYTVVAYLVYAISVKWAIPISVALVGLMLIFTPLFLIDHSPAALKPGLEQRAQVVSVQKTDATRSVKSDFEEAFKSPLADCEDYAPPLIPKHPILKNIIFEQDYWLASCEEDVAAGGCDIWTDGTKITHPSIFGDLDGRAGSKISRGSREGENVNFYYNFEPLHYSRSIVDSGGDVVSKREFSVNLVLKPGLKVVEKPARAPGEDLVVYTLFDVIEYTFLTCTWK